jgi:PLP dependent protein
MEDVRANLERVRDRMARAARRAGRRPEDILLIAVSKSVLPERIREALAAGVPALAENRVQEARDKVRALGRPVPWHLIGHLQTNKVKDAIELFDVIQSVDRLPLALELARRARRPLSILVEVNLAGEPAKSGFAPAELKAAVEALQALPRLEVGGLMAIPPAGVDPEHARPWFRSLRELRDAVGLRELSVGMSADFEVAIEEGATMVRVGTAIFGARPGAA